MGTGGRQEGEEDKGALGHVGWKQPLALHLELTTMSRILTLLVCLTPAWALSQTVGGPVGGTSIVVNNKPGDQSEPHISGTRVVYTNPLARALTEVRHHDLTTGVDLAIPQQGDSDFAPDVQGQQVVFTRADPNNRLFAFDIAQGGVAQELAPRTNVDRRGAVMGGSLVAFQESGYTASLVPPEIFTYRLDTQSLTRLSDDARVDLSPFVSEDGQAVVWSKCTTYGSGCDIWTAQATSGGYTLTQLTGTEGEETQPTTNGEDVVYVSKRVINGTTESDIAWQPLGGGDPQYLSLPGPDGHPSMSGPLIAFEHWDASSTTPNYDIMLYDLRTETLYRLTQTPGSELLSDISMDAEGVVRVAWSVRQSGDLNIHALVFRLRIDCPYAPPPDAALVCANPGLRPLLASLQVVRSSGEPELVSTPFVGKGSAVLCVDNGHGGSPATDGQVWLGSGLAVAPEEFGAEVSLVSRPVPLQGQRLLSAGVGGASGSAFRVRLYGEAATCSVGLTAPSSNVPELHSGEALLPRLLALETDGSALFKGFVAEGDEGLSPPP